MTAPGNPRLGIPPSDPPSDPAELQLQARRDRMVDRQIASPERGVRNPRVLAAMRRVRRHNFVQPAQVHEAYEDHPLPIGFNQTISQPFIVALMTELIDPLPTDRVLEIGTGSGYQTAVLAELAKVVYSIEIIEPLAHRAAALLEQLGYHNIHIRSGDASRGWPDAAPFDCILAACAPETIPPILLDQLAPGGRMILPVGPLHQQTLHLLTRNGQTISDATLIDVRFVPMTSHISQPGAT